MSEAEFATQVVEILEKGKDLEGDTMRESFYVWAWRRAREIHELKLEAEVRKPVVVKMVEVA